jgi:predicted transcriptional regulator
MRVNKRVKVQVGSSLREATGRVLADVRRFERGEDVNENRLVFEDWQALFALLTPKRYELLAHVHQHPEPSIRALAHSLNRDIKNVHGDVAALRDAGLLECDEEGVRADYDRIETEIAL